VGDELSGCGGGVDLLGDAPEGNLLRGELVDGLNQVREGVGEAIQAPDNQGVPVSEVGECLIEPWALLFGAGNLVGEDVSVCAAGLAERIQLEIKILFSS